MPDDVMTVDELAKYLKLSKPNIYSKVYTGQIPFFRAGDPNRRNASIRFLRRDIDAWIEDRKQGVRSNALSKDTRR